MDETVVITKETYFLFLDDFRLPEHISWVNLPPNINWKITRTYDQFIKTIETYGLPIFISFDHDLTDAHYKLYRICHDYRTFLAANKDPSGYDCALWLIDYCKSNKLKIPPYNIHSANKLGAEEIRKLLEKAKLEIK